MYKYFCIKDMVSPHAVVRLVAPLLVQNTSWQKTKMPDVVLLRTLFCREEGTSLRQLLRNCV